MVKFFILTILLLIVSVSWARYVKPSKYAPPKDKLGKVVHCPVHKAETWEFEHLGNRLMYEGKFKQSHACFLRALDELFESGQKVPSHPSNIEIESNPNATFPIVSLFESEAHFTQVFPRSANVPHETFSSMEMTSLAMKEQLHKAIHFDKDEALARIRQHYRPLPLPSHSRKRIRERLLENLR